MANFYKDNGKEGFDRVSHTATGYECFACHPGNHYGVEYRITFFARHIVDRDGRPHVEIGLSGLEHDEKASSMLQLKQALKAANIKEVRGLNETKPDIHCFTEHKLSDSGTVALRLDAGENGLSLVTEAIGNLISDVARQFIQEQESVDNVLFHSIFHQMGEEMCKGPGGEKAAKEKAHRLAQQFMHGIEGTEQRHQA